MKVFATTGKQRGDTIVEVMFAIAVFAFVAAGSLAVMRQGISTSMRSLEITQVRQTMNDQAELLRYIQQETLTSSSASPSDYNNVWNAITNPSASPNRTRTNATAYGTCDPGAAAHAFVLDPQQIDTADPAKIILNPTLGISNPGLPPYPQIIYPGISAAQAYDFWVESVPSPSSVTGPKYVDFHIRACWSAPGNSAPMTLGTIVRLYEK